MAANKPYPSGKWKSNPEGDAEISKVAAAMVGAKDRSPQDEAACPQFQRGRHTPPAGPEDETTSLKDRALRQRGYLNG